MRVHFRREETEVDKAYIDISGLVLGGFAVITLVLLTATAAAICVAVKRRRERDTAHKAVALHVLLRSLRPAMGVLYLSQLTDKDGLSITDYDQWTRDYEADVVQTLGNDAWWQYANQGLLPLMDKYNAVDGYEKYIQTLVATHVPPGVRAYLAAI